ncbi:MAG: ABC transporter permease [Lachnospiraceae bacterium]|nr:ABC transporter permease [Lachnospiraceae bacterium]
MVKYFFKRLFRGLLSVIAVVAIIMLLVYGLMDRTLIFNMDENYAKLGNNTKIAYRYQKWDEYGYLTYVTYSSWLNSLLEAGEIDEDTYNAVATIGRTAEDDSEETAYYIQQFYDYYDSQGYKVVRLDAKMTTATKVANGGAARYFAYKNKSLVSRVVTYFTSLLSFDDIHYVDEDVDIGERGLTFTLYDPAYGGEKFAPAILGNGTQHKYLLYFSSEFPYIHQNFVTLTLGESYSVNTGVDVFKTMVQKQGSYVTSTVYYPTGYVEESADDVHTATYVEGSLALSTLYQERYTDDYTNVELSKSAMSKMAYSFICGIFASLLAYAIGLPLGVLMARKKDTWVDSLGNAYIVFMIAVPSLAYIFMFKAISGALGLPTTFTINNISAIMFVAPILSMAIGSIAGRMKWMRRYMVDQLNSDYVKFARACGTSESDIYIKHIFKNAAIPITHGIPGTILGALGGSIITERVYSIPGVGGMLVQAITYYDNSVIVGVALFYGIISIVAAILGDILMAVMDPRINYTTKAR